MIGLLRRFFAEYRSMLKATELEEGLDLILFRPFAYLLVKIFQPTSVTPNQITLITQDSSTLSDLPSANLRETLTFV